jgi:hypothetical protein
VPIEPWSCYHYRSRNGEELQGEVWTAATSALGLEAADTRALTSLVEMMSQMAGNAESLHELGARDAGTDFTGFPVKQVTYVSGQAVSSSTTRIANQGQLDATLFVIPDGYREVPFMELLMGDGLGQ